MILSQKTNNTGHGASRYFAGLLALGFILISTICGATETLRDAMSYTRLGAGARARAMGDCFIATADDVTAINYNPAGLARIDHGQVHTMKDNLSADRALNLFAAAMPFWSGTLGLSYSSYGVSDIPETYLDTTTSIGLDFDGNPIYDVKTSGFFKNYQSTAAISWARRLTRKSKIGFGVKRYSHELREASALGYGFDAGVVFNPLPNLSLGFSLRDMGGHLDWNTASNASDTVPVTAGFGIHFDHESWLSGALDIVSTQDARVKVNTGFEFRLGDAISLRAGMNAGNITTGVGLKVAGGSYVDAAYHAEDLGPAYRLSGTITFEDFRRAKRKVKSKNAAAVGAPERKPQDGPAFTTAELVWENRTVTLHKTLAAGGIVMASLKELEEAGLVRIDTDSDGLFTASVDSGVKATLREGDSNFLVSTPAKSGENEKRWAAFPVPPMKAGAALMIPVAPLLVNLGIHAIIGIPGESSHK